MLSPSMVPSKCRGVEDLSCRAQARTFGFRGQALAALSRISSLDIITRERGATLSWSKAFCGGKVLHCQPLVTLTNPVGGSAVLSSSSTYAVRHYGISAYGARGGGTSVFVRNLFYNQPVRKKRLKPKAELYDALARMRRIALVLPEVEFVFEDGATSRVLFRRLRNFGLSQRNVSAGGAMQAAFESCFGVSHGCNFVELSGSDSSKMVFTDRRACNIKSTIV